MIDGSPTEIVDGSPPKIIDETSSEIIDDDSPEIIEKSFPDIVEDSSLEIIEDSSPLIINESFLEINEECSPGVIEDNSPELIEVISPEIIDDISLEIIYEISKKILEETKGEMQNLPCSNIYEGLGASEEAQMLPVSDQEDATSSISSTIDAILYLDIPACYYSSNSEQLNMCEQCGLNFKIESDLLAHKQSVHQGQDSRQK